jgi:hypothetical protein
MSITWNKTKGSVANMTRCGSAIYAISEDKRFRVYVSRYLKGDPGHRRYTYWFSAIDYGIPSDTNRWTEIRMSQYSMETMNKKKAFEVVEKWADEHPLTQQEFV